MILCPKCGKGEASLAAFTEILESGIKLQTVRCICGWRISRPAPKTTIKIAKTPYAWGYNASETCTVAGCAMSYRPRTDALPMCWKHRRRMEQWLKSQHRTPAPIQKIDGVWTETKAPLGRPKHEETLYA